MTSLDTSSFPAFILGATGVPPVPSPLATVHERDARDTHDSNVS